MPDALEPLAQTKPAAEESTTGAPLSRKGIKTRFTRANAREMQARSVAAKRAAALARVQPQQPLQSDTANGSANAPIDPFLADRLTRVRRQLARLDSLFETACAVDVRQIEKMSPAEVAKALVCLDATHIDRLASAIARLSEIERQLADRPLPGSKRPEQKTVRSRASLLFDNDPAPARPAPTGIRVEQE